MLSGHTGDVNAIRFFPTAADQQTVILSGSVDTTIRIWQSLPQGDEVFREAAVVESHAGSVNCLAVCTATSLVASASTDASVKIWKVCASVLDFRIDLVHTIPTIPRFFPLALSLHRLDAEGNSLLAVAGTRSAVHVHIIRKDGSSFPQTALMGHDAWIRSLAISQESDTPDSDLLLASASQDKYIRLWRIAKTGTRSSKNEGDFLDVSDQSLTNKAHKLEVSQCIYTITFEALLLGHEDWIYTVAWRLEKGRLHLLSASADNSLAVWELEGNSGIWVCTTRLGEISSQKGSTTATGSTGGFWIGLWSPDGKSLVSLGRTGGWRLWKYDKSQVRWAQGLGVSGHTKSVTDVAWSKHGMYLLSTSSDQTTRLHAAWKHSTKRSWHEMARPQIHGYDLNCIDSIDGNQFISGADEKLLRVFDEPRTTAKLLECLCGVETETDQDLPDAAAIPVLGLSNKAIEEGETSFIDNNDSVPSARRPDDPQDIENPLNKPPFEDQLARHTLWPETEKLYGHGYEISTVAASHDGTLIATTCRASSVEHAVIRVYRTHDWREVNPSLTVHSLTVTALRFADDDQYLLSVGRDRRWAVFERDTNNPDSFSLQCTNPKGHSRMILDVAWAPLDTGRVFATAGRDKTIKIWKMNGTVIECTVSITLSSPVTAVDICPRLYQDSIVIASGTELGVIGLDLVQTADWSSRPISELDEL